MPYVYTLTAASTPFFVQCLSSSSVRTRVRQVELTEEHVLKYCLSFIEDVHSGMLVDPVSARDTFLLWLQTGSANRHSFGMASLARICTSLLRRT